MRIDILCLFPQSIQSFFEESMLKRAREKGLVEVFFHNLREYSDPPHFKVDDEPFGGEAGMVMLAEPIARCIDFLEKERTYEAKIFLTPDGKTLNQQTCNQLSTRKNLLLLCGHYKGIDQRIRDRYITQEISIGDYVLTGGELPAAILSDAIIRLIPGVLSDATAALTDSFQDHLLAPPVYTRPAVWREMPVPEILRSGHAQKIAAWKESQALEKTQKIRPDLLEE